MNAIVKDVMTARVVAVKQGASFKEIAARLRQSRVSAFPVIDDEEKVIGVGHEPMPGMITGMLARQEQKKAGGLTAGDLMTHPAVTVGPEDPIEHAARMMYTLRVKRLPVVTAGGRLVGIISRADVLSVYDRPDAEIRREIIDDVTSRESREDWRELAVTLAGSPGTAALGYDIVDKVRHVRGVVAVRDRLSYPGVHSVAVGSVL
jgi:CBS-domain-containing membrane protein